MPRKFTETHRKRLSVSISKGKLGVKFSEDHKKALSEAAKRRPRVPCSVCGKVVAINTLHRWHEDACKKHPKNKKEEKE